MWNQTNTTKCLLHLNSVTTLPIIKRPSCIKTNNVITDNCKTIRRKYQLFDSTSERKLKRPQLLQKHNVRIKSSARKWPLSALTQAERRRRHWRTAAAMKTWRSLAHSILILLRRLRSLRSVMRVLYTSPSLAVRSTRCSQPDLYLANLEATVAEKWTLAFLIPRTPR